MSMFNYKLNQVDFRKSEQITGLYIDTIVHELKMDPLKGYSIIQCQTKITFGAKNSIYILNYKL